MLPMASIRPVVTMLFVANTTAVILHKQQLLVEMVTYTSAYDHIAHSHAHGSNEQWTL